jgi:hypothetical protein
MRLEWGFRGTLDLSSVEDVWSERDEQRLVKTPEHLKEEARQMWMYSNKITKLAEDAKLTDDMGTRYVRNVQSGQQHSGEVMHGHFFFRPLPPSEATELVVRLIGCDFVLPTRDQ